MTSTGVRTSSATRELQTSLLTPQHAPTFAVSSAASRAAQMQCTPQQVCQQIVVSAGTELYPRIGKTFDIKTWTNCRMGMMSWTFITICFAFKQYRLSGYFANSMLVSIVLSSASLSNRQLLPSCLFHTVCRTFRSMQMSLS
jgi:hypothetical protein